MSIATETRLAELEKRVAELEKQAADLAAAQQKVAKNAGGYDAAQRKAK
jgi:hypothetical protein